MNDCPVCGGVMTEYGTRRTPASDSRYVCARCGHGYDPSFAIIPPPLHIAPGQVYVIEAETIKADLIAFPLACPACGHAQPHAEGGRFCIECGALLASTGETTRIGGPPATGRTVRLLDEDDWRHTRVQERSDFYSRLLKLGDDAERIRLSATFEQAYQQAEELAALGCWQEACLLLKNAT
jgi:hypothetical protein